MNIKKAEKMIEDAGFEVLRRNQNKSGVQIKKPDGSAQWVRTVVTRDELKADLDRLKNLSAEVK